MRSSSIRKPNILITASHAIAPSTQTSASKTTTGIVTATLPQKTKKAPTTSHRSAKFGATAIAINAAYARKPLPTVPL